MFKSLRKLAPMLMLSSFVTLAACAHRTPSAAIEAAPPPAEKPAACSEFRPIIFSRLHDTVETIAQVKAHNAAYVALCGMPK